MKSRVKAIVTLTLIGLTSQLHPVSGVPQQQKFFLSGLWNRLDSLFQRSDKGSESLAESSSSTKAPNRDIRDSGDEVVDPFQSAGHLFHKGTFRLRGGIKRSPMSSGTLEYYDLEGPVDGNDISRYRVEFEDIGVRQGTWKPVCAPTSSWGLPEAHVLCRQLGFVDGAIFAGQGSSATAAGLSFESASFDPAVGVKMVQISCQGEENDLGECKLMRPSRSTPKRDVSSGGCDSGDEVVQVVCKKPSSALCPPAFAPFLDMCYKVELDSVKDFKAAQAECGHLQQQAFLDPLSGSRDIASVAGGRLVEITDARLASYLNELLSHATFAQEGPLLGMEGHFWTGGIRTEVAGRAFYLWHGTGRQVKRHDFKESSKPPQGPKDGGAMGVAAHPTKGWTLEDLDQKLPFICEMPQLDVGCSEDSSGADYNGTASTGESGKACIPWNTPEVPQVFEGQSAWNHSFCRNPGGQEEAPVCFIDAKNYDLCEIPRCTNHTRRRHLDSDDGQGGALRNLVNPEKQSACSGNGCQQKNTCHVDYEWQCNSLECIHVNNFCDQVADCQDASDEGTPMCDLPVKARLVNLPDDPTEDALQGSGGAFGRLEIRLRGIWGTVCNDHFGDTEAAVACRWLGFGEGRHGRVYNGTKYVGASGGPIWLRLDPHQACNGSEASLMECKTIDLWHHDHYCEHMEDVALDCEAKR